VTRCRLEALQEAGVNRVSLGVQQLDDEVLRRNGRVHLVADVEQAWSVIRSLDFAEVNVDLMVGLVGETASTFHQSLERVLQMAPESVTLYQLEVPLNTPLYRAFRAGSLDGILPTWETKRARLAQAFTRLEQAGYTLRSAYAAARNTRHRRFVYQEDQYRGADLLGIGVSSLSYVAGAHYQNLAAPGPYLANLAEGQLPLGRAYLLSTDERLVREFVLQLKLGSVEVNRFQDKFGIDVRERFAEPLRYCASRGWLTFDRRAVTLTREGLLRVDRMLPAFYLPEHRGLRYS
jgi:oxygen-independent coproporphyrinogen-3 oxidase